MCDHRPVDQGPPPQRYSLKWSIQIEWLRNRVLRVIALLVLALALLAVLGVL